MPRRARLEGPVLAATLAALVLPPACAAAPGTGLPPRFQGDLTGLERAARAPLDELYRLPGLDLGRYRAVLVEPVGLAPDLETDDYPYRESDLRFVQRLFRERVAAALAADFELVEEPGPEALRVRLILTGIRSNRRPLDRSPSGPGVIVTRSRGVGAAAMQVELRDAGTGELLLAGADRAEGWELSWNLNKNTTWGDAARAFDRWGRILHRLLLEAGARGPARPG
jgi:hypothetical protein